MRIGLIGTGAMGKQMAIQLVEAGHELTVWNIEEPPLAELAQRGAKIAATAAEALQGDITLSVLFDDAAIRAVLLGPDGLARAGTGCIHVCTSTISMDFARRLEQAHAEHGVRYVGATMLGRPEVIPQRALNFLVGGEAGLVDTVEPALLALGRVWRLGAAPQHAQAAKLATNFMISGALQAMAEAAAALKGHGVDTDRFFSVMGDTFFGAFIYKSYSPMVSGHPPAVASGLLLPLKDNDNFIKAAEAVGMRAPLAEVVRSAMQRATDAGGGALDWSTALAKVAQGWPETTA